MSIEKSFEYTPVGHYVYVHRKKSTGQVFYIGKGKLNRGWRKVGRNSIWHNIANKHGVVCEIVLDNLPETTAFMLEIDLITHYGRLNNKTGILANLTDGGEGQSGAVVSPESTKKQVESYKKGSAGKRYADSMKKKIIMDESVCFDSVGECSKFVSDLHNVNPQKTHICRVANLKAYTYLGHVFRWIDSEKEPFYQQRNTNIECGKRSRATKLIFAQKHLQKRKVIRGDGLIFNSVKDASDSLVSEGKAKNFKSAKSAINSALRGEIRSAFGFEWRLFQDNAA